MDDIRTISYRKDQLEGIDQKVLKSHKKGDFYIFNTTYPDHDIIMKYCSNADSRKKMNTTFNSVAKKNLSILTKIIRLRYERSKLFGFTDSVDYYLSYNRIASLKKIKLLLNKLIPILKRKAKKEYQHLLDISGKKELYDYDMLYYSELEKDDKILKKYFPESYTIPKILKIYADIFGLKIVLEPSVITKPKVNKKSNSNIQLYKVTNKIDDRLLGYFYLDLYPREGKYTHAATFELQNEYKDMNDKRIIPVSAILCNFSYPYLNFKEVVTFCHEFGHVLHNILSEAKYELLTVEHDFGEMPSQFFENWCYNKDFLKKISYNEETKKPLSNKLIQLIQKNRNLNCGIYYLTQILYIKYDLELHSTKSNQITEKYVHDLWFKLCKELLPFKCSKNNYPMCRFDHIIGYASCYYGYLWTIIYAYDAFSLFDKKGIFNKKLGLRFRREILEKSGTVKGIRMLENFMKNKLDNRYFFRIFE